MRVNNNKEQRTESILTMNVHRNAVTKSSSNNGHLD